MMKKFLTWTAMALIFGVGALNAQISLSGYETFWVGDSIPLDGIDLFDTVFGHSSEAGDFNCDGYDDLAIGASGSLQTVFSGPELSPYNMARQKGSVAPIVILYPKT